MSSISFNWQSYWSEILLFCWKWSLFGKTMASKNINKTKWHEFVNRKTFPAISLKPYQCEQVAFFSILLNIFKWNRDLKCACHYVILQLALWHNFHSWESKQTQQQHIGNCSIIHKYDDAAAAKPFLQSLKMNYVA